MPNPVYTFLSEQFLTLFFNEPDLICLHTVKCLHLVVFHGIQTFVGFFNAQYCLYIKDL